MADYLLESNYLIFFADKDSNPEKRREVLLEMQEKLQDDNNQFFCNELIRYEFLRGVDWGDEQKRNAILSAIEQFDALEITSAVSDLASDLYRFDRHESTRSKIPKNLEKRKFDMFHYATAKVHHLEMMSKDNDMVKIDKLYQTMQKAKNI